MSLRHRVSSKRYSGVPPRYDKDGTSSVSYRRGSNQNGVYVELHRGSRAWWN